MKARASWHGAEYAFSRSFQTAADPDGVEHTQDKRKLCLLDVSFPIRQPTTVVWVVLCLKKCVSGTLVIP